MLTLVNLSFFNFFLILDQLRIKFQYIFYLLFMKLPQLYYSNYNFYILT